MFIANFLYFFFYRQGTKTLSFYDFLCVFAPLRLFITHYMAVGYHESILVFIQLNSNVYLYKTELPVIIQDCPSLQVYVILSLNQWVPNIADVFLTISIVMPMCPDRI